MTKTLAITEEVTDVLRRSTIANRADGPGASLKLPDQVLPRPLYMAVNKVLEHAGGTWDKRAKAHLFTDDPSERLGVALQPGVAQFATEHANGRVKAKEKKKELQAFYTPPDLAASLVSLADVAGHEVLEPQCGEGSLIAACLAAGAKSVTGMDIDKHAVAHATAAFAGCPNVFIGEADFLQFNGVMKFPRIVMNPPFAKSADCKHVLRAYRHLAAGGKLAAIMFCNTERPLFRRLLETLKADGSHHTIVAVPSGAFKESGTDVPTIILTILKS